MSTSIDELIDLYQSEFKQTDLYQDIGSYKDMTLLELSKKLPKWKSNYNNILKPLIDGNNRLAIVRYVNKHCKNCDKNVIFEINQCKHIQRKYSYVKFDFVRVYRKLLFDLCREATVYFDATRSDHETDMKQRMAAHQKTQITCECGGKYSLRNKQKHIKTSQHIIYCQPSNS